MNSYDEKIEREQRAERLVAARKNAGFRGPQPVSDKFGWNINSYKAHESGRNGFNPTRAQEYAKAFGVSLDWLLFGTGEMLSGESVSVDLDEIRDHVRAVARDIVNASNGRIPYDPDDFASAFVDLLDYRIEEPGAADNDQQNVVKFQMRRIAP
ncbi:hypothetical protein MXMO3_01778 [Maritalea myrionectae]|uniref:HTH cro/C1-type domain-containing protein n=1 Tax=Maritalea myrionectae TaxID=454601 RepID=A0A2R4MEA3_9HYPH|nr:helix-turn-helix transcriptional regulator [Maritalea myrionectae]AVX04303.1 hypothetical protein MXMO3_01778 [Maritalea myrionectae]